MALILLFLLLRECLTWAGTVNDFWVIGGSRGTTVLTYKLLFFPESQLFFYKYNYDIDNPLDISTNWLDFEFNPSLMNMSRNLIFLFKMLKAFDCQFLFKQLGEKKDLIINFILFHRHVLTANTDDFGKRKTWIKVE